MKNKNLSFASLSRGTVCAVHCQATIWPRLMSAPRFPSGPVRRPRSDTRALTPVCESARKELGRGILLFPFFSATYSVGESWGCAPQTAVTFFSAKKKLTKEICLGSGIGENKKRAVAALSLGNV